MIDYTCCCQAVYYELIGIGGIYQVHKVIQSDPPEHLYTGGWSRPHASVWWMQILTGAAR
ncbi:hypothetical protein HS048_06350 [Planomonospora sp. ID91781]|uniref:hypothetical protein n=1 Tax=Planomonospora sp. ID91781 TaxID=2738135 RepID=UPI0018C43DDD|nr:hypothetical protein [Planomonospora sp. ID91781]MBG0820356.1 hypothetical protein [Planomonospora sp. ID91781]